MTHLLIRLYPAPWRARYGEEFAALLEERPMGPFDVADVLLGALDARLHLRGVGAPSQQRKGFTMSLRIGGIAAIFGGILWAIAFAWMARTQTEAGSELLLAVTASVALLVALVGLSAFQSREHPLLVWTAFALPAIGTLLSIVGMVGMLIQDSDGPFIGPWPAFLIFMVGLIAALIGSSLFALATYRTRVLSRAGALILLIASPLVLVAVLGLMGGSAGTAGVLIGALSLIAFSLGWVLLGWTAIRLDRPLGQANPA